MSLAKQKLIILESVDSTNNYAMALIRDGHAINGDAVFAVEQTSGKGTRGKHWKSNKGENITFSIMQQMQWQSVLHQFPLSVAVATGCLNFVLGHVTSDATIKWPNDIFIGDRKAGGILIENVLKSNLWQWSVIGVGININQVDFQTDMLKATSLKMITGRNYDVITLARELHERILENITILRAGRIDELIKNYNDHLFRKNQLIKIKKEHTIFETTITTVTKSGELLTHDAIERKFNFGEVSWVEY